MKKNWYVEDVDLPNSRLADFCKRITDHGGTVFSVFLIPAGFKVVYYYESTKGQEPNQEK